MKKLLYSALSLILMLSLSACNDSKSEAENKIYAKVVDHAEREIIFEKKAESLVTSYYITTSALLALGLADSIVALENNSNYRALYSFAAPRLLDLPGVGTAKTFDLEATMALEPDLVIVPLRLTDTAKSLEELGKKVICVNPESQKQLEESLLMIGQATGTSERAQKLIDRMSQSLSSLAKSLESAPAPRVYLASNSGLLVTAGKKMYQNSLIKQANAQNVAESIDDTYWASISYEQLIEYNPDFIIITPSANYSVEDVLNDKNVQELDAIKNKKVYKMPSSIEAWDSPVPSSYLGSLWIASVIHPTLFSNADFMKEVQHLYKEFYGFDVNPEIVK